MHVTDLDFSHSQFLSIPSGNKILIGKSQILQCFNTSKENISSQEKQVIISLEKSSVIKESLGRKLVKVMTTEKSKRQVRRRKRLKVPVPFNDIM